MSWCPSPRRPNPTQTQGPAARLTSSRARCTVTWLYTRAPSSGLTARSSSFCSEKSCAPASTPSASTVLSEGSRGAVRQVAGCPSPRHSCHAHPAMIQSEQLRGAGPTPPEPHPPITMCHPGAVVICFRRVRDFPKESSRSLKTHGNHSLPLDVATRQTFTSG